MLHLSGMRGQPSATDLLLDSTGQQQIHVVAAQKQVLANCGAGEADSLAAPRRRLLHRDEREVGRSAADVAHEDLVACFDFLGESGMLREPVIKRRLRFFEQHQRCERHLGSPRRFHGQLAGHLIKRGRNGQRQLDIRHRCATLVTKRRQHVR